LNKPLPNDSFEGMEATGANFKRLLGEEGARALASAFGGHRLYIPKAPGAHHPITVALGHKRAQRLAAAFCGSGIDIPMLPRVKAEIRRLGALGLTRAAIARELKVTERWVYKTLAEPASTAAPQPSLFD